MIPIHRVWHVFYELLLLIQEADFSFRYPVWILSTRHKLSPEGLSCYLAKGLAAGRPKSTRHAASQRTLRSILVLRCTASTALRDRTGIWYVQYGEPKEMAFPI